MVEGFRCTVASGHKGFSYDLVKKAEKKVVEPARHKRVQCVVTNAFQPDASGTAYTAGDEVVTSSITTPIVRIFCRTLE